MTGVQTCALPICCFCHELEHLDGHLYTERAYQMMTQEEYEQMLKSQEEEEA